MGSKDTTPVDSNQPKTETASKPVEKPLNLQNYLRENLNDNTIEITDITGYILIKAKCSIDTKSGLSYECYQLLNTARTRPEYKKASKIGIMITADLTNQYGNTSNDKIFMQDFDKSELNKVNWDSIDQSSIYNIGETPWYHGIIKLDI